jgi:hypothetical protein
VLCAPNYDRSFINILQRLAKEQGFTGYWMNNGIPRRKKIRKELKKKTLAIYP